MNPEIGKKYFEKNVGKIWKFKNKAYLCIPVRETGFGNEVKKFIEKTEEKYKKQVPRNTIYREALILLKGIKNKSVSDKLRVI